MEEAQSNPDTEISMHAGIPDDLAMREAGIDSAQIDSILNDSEEIRQQRINESSPNYFPGRVPVIGAPDDEDELEYEDDEDFEDDDASDEELSAPSSETQCTPALERGEEAGLPVAAESPQPYSLPERERVNLAPAPKASPLESHASRPIPKCLSGLARALGEEDTTAVLRTVNVATATIRIQPRLLEGKIGDALENLSLTFAGGDIHAFLCKRYPDALFFDIEIREGERLILKADAPNDEALKVSNSAPVSKAWDESPPEKSVAEQIAEAQAEAEERARKRMQEDPIYQTGLEISKAIATKVKNETTALINNIAGSQPANGEAKEELTPLEAFRKKADEIGEFHDLIAEQGEAIGLVPADDVEPTMIETIQEIGGAIGAVRGIISGNSGPVDPQNSKITEGQALLNQAASDGQAGGALAIG